MNKVVIKLKRSFNPNSYFFGYSTVNNILNVTNWQDSNETFFIQNDGIYYFFAKHKTSNKFFVLQKSVSCGGVQAPCSISFLAPYFTETVVNQDIYETDWTDGLAGGCNISFLNPYQN
jgi:hypothetical protein